MVGRFRWIGVAALAFMGLLVLGIAAMCIPSSPVSADPPADQDYTGSKRCASCHFEQYTKWKASSHAKAFSLLTKKYEADEKCLKCHTTGYGEKTGYGAVKDDSLKDVGCEVCHGPGSKHEEAAKPFANVKELTKEQEEQLRGTIWRMVPKNVCIECHLVQGHGESPTPPDMKKKKK
jgi:hypothetical protein